MISMQSSRIQQISLDEAGFGHVVRSRFFASIWTSFWVVTFIILAAVSVGMSQGHLIYTLDDPYIHLSLANRIWHGNFGINEHEFASPSSSILYPLILVPTIAAGLGTMGPILINSVVTGLSVWLMIEFLWRYTARTWHRERWFIHLLCPLAILSINAYGLPMTGMEHSLHVLTVIVTMREMAAVAEGRQPSLALFTALICMPFLRFEGLALAGAAIAALFWLGRSRAATIIGLVIVAGLAVDVAVMRHLGLPFLPSSVLVKSKSAADLTGGVGVVSMVKGLAVNVVTGLQHRWGLIFGLMLCVLAGASRRLLAKPDTFTSHAVCIFLLLAGLGAHLMAGQYGWFHRYEVYAVALLVMGTVWLFGPELSRFRVLRTRAGQVVALVALALLVEPYAEAALLTPFAARNIYEQQFQMHRFATDFFPHRVAVNDLGWVSFQNNAFVLDLWGLGSEPVRKIRAAGPIGKSDIDRLTATADVDYAMIYGAWFVDAIPDAWCPMAVLHSQQVTSAGADVLFFATKASVRNEMGDALHRFAATLPVRVTLTTAAPCP